MQALQPSIKNGRSVWDAEALPKESFRAGFAGFRRLWRRRDWIWP